MAATVLGRFRVEKYEGTRFYGVYDGDSLVCVTVYKKGAREVERRLIGYELALLSLSKELQEVNHENSQDLFSKTILVQETKVQKGKGIETSTHN